MARYIDADEALKQIQALKETDAAIVGKKQFAEGFFCGLDEAEVILMRTPTADVVEVVRCKDCIHCEMDYPCKFKDEEAIAGYRCKVEQRYVPPEHFCSYGRRKE